MNWVLILVLLIIAISVEEGYRRGLLRIVYSLVSWIIVFVFIAYITPYVNQMLLEHTGIYEQIQTRFEESVQQSTQEQVGTGLEERTDELEGLQMRLPDVVMEQILGRTADAADHFLEDSGVYARVAAGMASFVVQGISYLITMLVAWIFVHVISQLLGIVSKLPLLKGVNRILGLFAGGIYGFFLVWIGFYVIALCSASDVGRILVVYIYNNPFLTFLYENNLVLTLALSFF